MSECGEERGEGLGQRDQLVRSVSVRGKERGLSSKGSAGQISKCGRLRAERSDGHISECGKERGEGLGQRDQMVTSVSVVRRGARA